jgi:hypothetical protein
VITVRERNTKHRHFIEMGNAKFRCCYLPARIQNRNAEARPLPFPSGGKMPRVHVFRSGDKWMIKSEGRVQGYFTDHAQAVTAAIDIAENIGNSGREAEVLVTEESRAYRRLWVYGKDLYPNSLGRPKNNRARGTYRLP